ncbi:MAG: hypothetical protein SFV21_20455 [Rhodospirillaceae bacterium]|nr:hypothetical protein [Rhodospirillaceae bacterium]
MPFTIDPDKPDVPALARIALWTGVTVMVGSVAALILAFSGYEWVNDIYAFAAAVLAFLIALILIGQGRTMEQLAVISVRVKSRFATEGAIPVLLVTPGGASGETRPPPIIPQRQKERVIHIPEQQAREQGVLLKK